LEAPLSNKLFFEHVRGHSKHKYNELADKLANRGRECEDTLLQYDIADHGKFRFSHFIAIGTNDPQPPEDQNELQQDSALDDPEGELNWEEEEWSAIPEEPPTQDYWLDSELSNNNSRPHHNITIQDIAIADLPLLTDIRFQNTQPPILEDPTEQHSLLFARKILHRGKKRAAVAPQTAPPELLIMLETLILPAMAHQLACISDGTVSPPLAWLLIWIIWLQKPGRDASIPSNWRPIGLMNCLRKSYLSVLLDPFRDFLSYYVPGGFSDFCAIDRHYMQFFV
jgi:hypothetical protein